jgi:Ca2+-binding RTX toxin-like protein
MRFRLAGAGALAMLVLMAWSAPAMATTTAGDGSEVVISGGAGAQTIMLTILAGGTHVRVLDEGGVTAQSPCIADPPNAATCTIEPGHVVTVLGGAGDDTIFGSDGAESISGGPGADTVYARDGDDVVDGGEDSDTIDCGAGTDTLTPDLADTPPVGCEHAAGGPPIMTSVGQQARHLTATWTKPAGMRTWFIEAATSPRTHPQGDFVDFVLFDDKLPYEATSYFSDAVLAPGNYWVHVGAFDPVTCNSSDCWQISAPLVLSIPADPAPASAASAPRPAVPADKATGFASLRIPSRQDVDRLYVAASMSERGTIRAGGAVGLPGTSKVLLFKKAARRALPGVLVKLRLRLSAKSLKTVKSRLRRGARLKARIAVTARDRAGNTRTRRRAVRLRP